MTRNRRFRWLGIVLIVLVVLILLVLALVLRPPCAPTCSYQHRLSRSYSAAKAANALTQASAHQPIAEAIESDFTA